VASAAASPRPSRSRTYSNPPAALRVAEVKTSGPAWASKRCLRMGATSMGEARRLTLRDEGHQPAHQRPAAGPDRSSVPAPRAAPPPGGPGRRRSARWWPREAVEEGGPVLEHGVQLVIPGAGVLPAGPQVLGHGHPHLVGVQARARAGAPAAIREGIGGGLQAGGERGAARQGGGRAPKRADVARPARACAARRRAARRTRWPPPPAGGPRRRSPPRRAAAPAPRASGARRARSAKKRWWLVSTICASAARRRMPVTKQRSK
jgi:hypothetical protein